SAAVGFGRGRLRVALHELHDGLTAELGTALPDAELLADVGRVLRIGCPTGEQEVCVLGEGAAVGGGAPRCGDELVGRRVGAVERARQHLQFLLLLGGGGVGVVPQDRVPV